VSTGRNALAGDDEEEYDDDFEHVDAQKSPSGANRQRYDSQSNSALSPSALKEKGVKIGTPKVGQSALNHVETETNL